jgi:hypothetical protein
MNRSYRNRGDRLVKIQWEGMTNFAFTRDLSN